MSVSIYGGKLAHHPEHGKCWEPAIDFRHWDEEILAEDPEKRHARGENPFLSNPDYIPDAGMGLATANARFLFDALGFELDPEGYGHFPIEEVARAALRGRNGPAANTSRETVVETGAGGATLVSCGLSADYMEGRISQLQRLIATARKHGATHIVVA